jgi:2-alkenal reductase
MLALLLSACTTTDRIVAQLLPTPTSAAAPAVPSQLDVTPTVPPTPVATPVPLPSAAPLPTAEVDPATASQEQLLVQLYRRVSPAVVSIQIRAERAADLPEGHPALPLPPPGAPTGQGSGFLFNDQGYIVTNNHVIEGASGINVVFYDGSVVRGRIVGADSGSDLAVVKVDTLPPDAAPVPLADSSEVAVGQMAVAIGNPFGLQNTLTVGVISGLGRRLIGPQSADGGNFSIPNVIQTDAAINPGNSGGPLLSARGELIGVNTAIASGDGSFDGVGYAVPANTVARVVPALIADGRYEHPWLGIGMFALTPDIAENYNIPVPQGVLVTRVVPNSPAEKAGLRVGEDTVDYGGEPLAVDSDIIVAVDGQPVKNGDDLIGYLEEATQVGQQIMLRVVRGGAEQELPLTLEARP